MFQYDIFSFLTPGTLSYLIYFFPSLGVVARYRDTQLQVTENVCDFWNLNPNMYQCFKIEGIFYF